MSRLLQRCLTRWTTRRKERGLTLPELLVTMGIISLIGLLLVETLSQSSSAMSLGTAKVEMDQTARIAIDRLTPLVMSATSGVGDAIIAPGERGSGAAYDDKIVFTTTEDFLSPTYDPADDWTVGDPTHVYQVRWDEDSQELRLEKVSTDFGVANPDPRVLAFRVERFQAIRLLSNTIEVRVTVQRPVKRPNGTTEDTRDTQVAIVQVPAESY